VLDNVIKERRRNTRDSLYILKEKQERVQMVIVSWFYNKFISEISMYDLILNILCPDSKFFKEI